MPATGKNLLLRLHVTRRALLQHYDDDTLHQLRVALRRLRSLLRHADSVPTRELRQALGQLADVTNAARDWDTLLSRARNSLSPRDFRRVQPCLEENRAASHVPVLDMLRSAEWARITGRLQDLIARGGLTPAGLRTPGDDVIQARTAVRAAWRKAQSADERKHWHKLRLAIKELRYTFDSVPQEALDASMSKTLKHCKRVQEILGAWHDTVVHVDRVQALARSLDQDAEFELHDLLKAWRKRMIREGGEHLDKAKAFLAGKGADLLQ